jgi:hypothetical protein
LLGIAAQQSRAGALTVAAKQVLRRPFAAAAAPRVELDYHL